MEGSDAMDQDTLKAMFPQVGPGCEGSRDWLTTRGGELTSQDTCISLVRYLMRHRTYTFSGWLRPSLFDFDNTRGGGDTATAGQ